MGRVRHVNYKVTTDLEERIVYDSSDDKVIDWMRSHIPPIILYPLLVPFFFTKAVIYYLGLLLIFLFMPNNDTRVFVKCKWDSWMALEWVERYNAIRWLERHTK